MPRLFDAYIIVDWSAAAKPVRGANSIWVACCAPDARGVYQTITDNPPTRLAARALICELARDQIARGGRVLIGFDFALGYPSGTAQALGLDLSTRPPWRAMFDLLAGHISESADNSNSRFALASSLNEKMSAEPHPFWGAVASQVTDTLSMKKGDFSKPESIAEHRIAERWVRSTFKAHPKSVWQLTGAGAVGSQSLLGIPTVAHLREALPNSQIWPFETGFHDFTPKQLENTQCVMAEIYPSTLPIQPKPGEILDELQVQMLSNHLESLDSSGKLGSAFEAPNSTSGGKISKIIDEEGWILAK